MTSLDKTKENPEAAFWEELDDLHSVMLGADGAGSHMQPMAPMADENNKTIWFFTSRDTDLAKAVNAASPAKMCAVNPDDGFYACTTGTMVSMMDKQIVDRFWSPVVEAWFPDGKDDPNLILLRFQPDQVALWKSSGSTLKFGWEIAKANLTDQQPDIGFQTNFRIVGA